MKKIVFSLLIIFNALSFYYSQGRTKIKDLELPKITKQDNEVVRHLGYTLSYNEKHEQANWVAYVLTAAKVVKTVKRSNHFCIDEAVSSGSATEDDYKNSGYDRGHLAPAGDMEWNEQAMEESFYYSNMSPQVPAFNRGIWKHLEELVRQWAKENQTIYIVTGPVLKGDLSTIGPDNVSVPHYYYKVILDYTEPELKGIGFIIPNASSQRPLQDYAVTIDSVEKVTGIDFFSALPDQQERTIEKNLCIACWSWTSTTN